MAETSPFSLSFRLNGDPCEVEVGTHELLVDVIRDRLGLTGTKKSCEVGVCGVCTVLLDGLPVSACAVLAFDVAGREVMTIEGLTPPLGLHPLQESFIEHGGFQCGFCTPGMILTAKALLDEHPEPTPAQISRHMNSNLCRCTGYQMIVESIADAAARMKGGA